MQNKEDTLAVNVSSGTHCGGVRQMLTMADKGGRGGKPNATNDITDKMTKKYHIWDVGCSPISDKIDVLNLLFLAAYCGQL